MDNTTLSLIALFIALIGGVPGSILIYNSLKSPTSLVFKIETEQVFISKIVSDNEKVDGRACIGIYQLAITGKSNNPTTIKDIRAFIKHNNKWIEASQYYIHKQSSSRGNNVIELSNGPEKVFLMSWNDNVIRESRVKIEFGETIITSLTYFFDIKDEELPNISKLRLDFYDYLGRKYQYKYSILSKNLDAFNKGLFVIDYACNDCLNAEKSGE